MGLSEFLCFIRPHLPAMVKYNPYVSDCLLRSPKLAPQVWLIIMIFIDLL